MNRLLTFSAFVVAGLVSSGVYAEDSIGFTDSRATDSIKSYFLQTESFEPCSYWAYNFETNGYSCRSTTFRVTVPEARSLDAIISDLDQRIQALEARILQLETQRP